MDEEEVFAALHKLDALYLVGMRLTGHLPHGRACGCTDWHAAWCPIHGDCTGCFPHDPYAKIGPLPGCPLHAEQLVDKLEGYKDCSGWLVVPSGAEGHVRPDLLPARLRAKWGQV